MCFRYYPEYINRKILILRAGRLHEFRNSTRSNGLDLVAHLLEHWTIGLPGVGRYSESHHKHNTKHLKIVGLCSAKLAWQS